MKSSKIILNFKIMDIHIKKVLQKYLNQVLIVKYTVNLSQFILKKFHLSSSFFIFVHLFSSLFIYFHLLYETFHLFHLYSSFSSFFIPDVWRWKSVLAWENVCFYLILLGIWSLKVWRLFINWQEKILQKGNIS